MNDRPVYNTFDLPVYTKFDTDIIHMVRKVKDVLIHRIGCSIDPRRSESEKEVLRDLNNYLAQAVGCTLAQWCDVMDRPKNKCGCPDCGSSLVQIHDSHLPKEPTVRDFKLQQVLRVTNLLRQWVKSSGLTKKQAAHRLGTDKATLNTILGKVPVDVSYPTFEGVCNKAGLDSTIDRSTWIDLSKHWVR